MAKFDGSKIKTIGVYASGGDAPGMNAAIRAVVRTGILRNLKVVGIVQGYAGFLEKDFLDMDLRSVANIIQRGGSILKAGRCPEFVKPEVRKQAINNIRERGIDGLICIGGDGSFTGANLLWQEHQMPIVGVPGTIDNDIFGTELTIGFDTAVNTALDAIDRIRDTAASHDRLFIIEVMGRDSGFIAVAAGLAGGAEDIFIPEHPFQIERTIEHIKRGISRGKNSSILVTAEGVKPGRAYDLAESIRKHSGFLAKVCILGHIQRGGKPSAVDRLIASRMSVAAVDQLINGVCDVMVGIKGEDLVFLELPQCLKQKKHVNRNMIELAQILSN
ncbi:MAG: 6-phosphofructokinase [Bdellovibrionales bacterium RBG_16_40_8]|nr:MAG: 6-phosphofructokinase [Bdellovibrionales bacterium RBG_16_40_8]